MSPGSAAPSPTPNKRSNKPMMERKRRERINNSLDQLKELILKAENKDASKYSKLEKADILEMAVKHVNNLHQHSGNSSVEVTKYKSGFSQCTAEVEAYLVGIRGFPSDIARGLMNHLHNVLNSVAKENIPQVTQKIKATTDKSIFSCRPIRPKLSHPLEAIQQCQQGPANNSESNQRTSSTVCRSSLMPCPLSPPSEEDSTSLSPQPQRLSQIIKHEIETEANSHLGLDLIFNRQSALTCYSPNEASPLNLTLHRQQERPSQTSPSSVHPSEIRSPSSYSSSHSLSVFATHESSLTPNLPPSPPSERFSPILHSQNEDNALSPAAVSMMPRAAPHLNAKQRPTPYPKKDAAQRYQNQILRRGSENPLHQLVKRESPVDDNASHWRPW